MHAALLDLLLPPHCAVCGTETMTAGLFCAGCFAAVRPIGDPSCKRCGTGFAATDYAGPRGVCAACEATPPPWDGGRAAFVYDEHSRRLILPLKYADRTENAAILARAMGRVGQEMLAGADIVAPVPLHRYRLWHRRYNQAALIAGALPRPGGSALVADLLQRTRRTPKLAHLNQAERRRAVTGAITVRPRHLARIGGRHIVLVDDVLTTGATLGACADVLKKAGARRVDVLVAARTAAPEDHVWELPYREASGEHAA